MSKLSITEAVKVIPCSESTLRRDIKRHKISVESDAKGRTRIDVSELHRVYGKIKIQNGSTPATPDTTQHSVSTNGSENNLSMTDTDTPKIVALLQAQVASLTTQLTEAANREKTLLDLVDRLQKQNERLMLPTGQEPSDRETQKPKRRSWLNPFRLT